jgi:hypothetical protein
MMIIQLPPEPDEHQLTAKAPIRQLADHKEFFLLFNNKNSWLSEEQYQYNYNLLSDRLLKLSTSKGCSLKSLKADAKYLKREFKRAGAVLKLHFIHTALSGALGYSSYRLARDCRTVDDFIENLWPADVILGKEFVEGRLHLEVWPSTRLLSTLQPRILFNNKRDKIAKVNDIDLKVIQRKQNVRAYLEKRYAQKESSSDISVDGHTELQSLPGEGKGV